MVGKIRCVATLAALLALAAMSTGREAEEKPTDGGKAGEFKGKTFDLDAKGKVKITLSFEADKEATLTVRSKKESDVNLFVYGPDGKLVKKDDSPGPSCDITFTPKKAGKYTLEIVNKGPGANSSTLKVKLAKAKE